VTTPQARRIILGAFVVIAGITFVREVRAGRMPEPRTAVGAFAAVIMLNALAGPAPQIAGQLALIGAVAHLIVEAERGTVGSIADVFTRR
jgi:hypothetical protein